MNSGNAGVSRTSIAELAHDNGLSPSRAFSLFGLCTAVGTLIGPLIGGFLSQPASKYGIHGPADLFDHLPFLLPCAISTTYNLAVACAAIFLLPETNMKLSGKAAVAPDGPSVGEIEEQPLLAKQEEKFTSSRAMIMLIIGHG